MFSFKLNNRKSSKLQPVPSLSRDMSAVVRYGLLTNNRALPSKLILPLCILLLAFGFSSCKKLVSIPEPVNSLTTSEVFSTDAQANSSLIGIYTQMISSGSLPDFGNGAISIYCGLSSDELIDYKGTADVNGYPFNTNNLLSTSGIISSNFWTSPYKYIYSANAAIEGLAASTGVHDSVRTELTGEAKFIRAFCYFYLTNLFGDVPMTLTTDWNKTALMTRTPQADVYKQIENDLTDAQAALPSDYSVGLGERIRPNKWAATALLARVYLYEKKWADAEAQASSVINNSSLYNLDTLNGVFLKNSKEAIWQVQQNNTVLPYNGTLEGNSFIPTFFSIPALWNVLPPNYYITDQLLNSFESGDERLSDWINSYTYKSATYYFPYKYFLSSRQTTLGGTISEYYMMLRLGEQYLIRAEARAQLGESNAVDDLNAIRNRAGLSNYSGATDQTSLLNAIYHERQVELFCEWGSRWLDLKRWQQAVPVLSQIPLHAAINNDMLLYPIPYSETQTNPNLTQNTGY